MATVFKKRKSNPFDINGDGVVDIKDFYAIFTGERYYEASTVEKISAKMNELWADNQGNVEVLAARLRRRLKTGQSFMYRWLSSNDKQIEKMFDMLVRNFDDRELEFYRNDYFRVSKKIDSLESNLDILRDESNYDGLTDTPTTGMLQFQAELDELHVLREQALTFFIERFRLYGVDLDRSQGEVLISRVDAKDIIQISIVLHVISVFTHKLAKSNRVSQDRLRSARKYYVVFSGLLELQMYVQQLYIDKINGEFIPHINNIVSESKKLYQQTHALYEGADLEHKSAYKLNMEAQAFNGLIAQRYREMLMREREQVVKAKRVVLKRWELTVNTIDTIHLATELKDLIQQNEGLFEAVIGLQTPKFEAFSCSIMRTEFIHITDQLNSIKY